MTTAGQSRVVRGPYFEELVPGQVFDTAPALTLTPGLVAQHRAIVGSRLRMTLDATLSRRVAGGEVVGPDAVWDTVIGQSTLATQNVRANLFYRGLVFWRVPMIGDTLTSTTVVEGLRQNRKREGRAPTGLAALRISALDQHGRTVLDFHRCAMIPLGDPSVDTGHADDLDRIGAETSAMDDAMPCGDWDIEAFRLAVPRCVGFDDVHLGETWEVVGGDVVSSAPELARLTLNVAAVHHDAGAAGGERLVYGGHTIGVAFAQLTRALPDVVCVVGWKSCSHLAPVREGDTLHSMIQVEGKRALAHGGLLDLRIITSASPRGGSELGAPVLDWRLVVLMP
ncbi:acyl dehydratase [Micromonospora globispora]|uniref:MaoC family dehydratase n=1 Tax=Micromonospora globispora TaxID=1450148 RepID=UPI000D6FF058|nr:MaoC family dehydratase [Micromonospora globispora]PWU62264.1 acyl dehydratase [Micromonospora globispora]RQW98953.1 acyl dehydratase [Micromonospora globispora]